MNPCWTWQRNPYFNLLTDECLTQGLFKPNPGRGFIGDKIDDNPVGDNFPPHYEMGENFQVQPKYLKSLDETCKVEPYDPPPVSDQNFPPFDQAKANVYRYRQQQSVNLGSWFVHEKWMTPSVFACASGEQISELDIAFGWGSTSAARAVLERHWDTFINQTDFDYLASIGINTVRLPIGYWSLGPCFCAGTPFEGVADVYQNSWNRVLRAINMASKAGIGVLVDLHGAPGSQNGQQHSGIQLLNEPKNVQELPDFYSNAISTMRQVSPAAANFPLYIHDGFDLNRFSDYVARRSDFVVQDHHSYFVFTSSDQSEPASQHTSDIQGSISDSLEAASVQQRRNLVVDEFSCALTDESLKNVGDPNKSRREFCEGQLAVYANATAGWAFWAYKKEDCTDDPGWCFQAAVGNSLPSSFFSYGGQGFTPSPSQLPSLADLEGDMHLPSTNDILSGAQMTPTDTSTYTASSSSTTAVGARINRRSRFGQQGRAPHLHRRGSHRRDGPGQVSMSSSQRAVAKGYSDGFLTAKIFAQYGGSKLGFVGQYIIDSLTKLGPAAIDPGTEDDYEQWFMKGLEDGRQLSQPILIRPTDLLVSCQPSDWRTHDRTRLAIAQHLHCTKNQY
ncbi:Glucan 1,3-beta-glucosidase 3 [Grifola frondosa]|uniref:Glucan 1,3-beta-glucosidase 3 n=1 Tax=Grifola frondosa TaxID=5627 RepID=A0A1C7MGD1_GRIFR|nr:Glucan 1,3-beta-glucosidase 3 [Grifola frondosa]